MRTRTMIHGALVLVTSLALSASCGKKDKDAKKKPTTPTGKTTKPVTPKADLTAEITDKVGIAAGGWEYPADVGAEGVLTAHSGPVQVRRIGTEAFKGMSKGSTLWAGDVVRTGADATATLTMSDETVIELSGDTVVAVGDRDSNADPASGAAVLYGVARFSVAERGTGEGPFMVFTPNGIIGTRGTTYAVGVAADGQAKVGVEEGKVEVAGSATPDQPKEVSGGKAAVIDGGGKVADQDFDSDDWGEWKDNAEADDDPAAVATVHAEAITKLEGETDAAYDELDKVSTDAEAEDAKATEQEKSDDGAAYDTGSEERGAAVEATFVASVRLNYLTYAMLSRAYMLQELHARHPAKVKPIFTKVRPRVMASILYHKKYHAVVHTRVRPMRRAYYIHHPRGRRHAAAAGVTISPFFKARRVEKDVRRKLIAKRFQRSFYRPPRVKKFNKKKRVFLGQPKVGWHASVKVRPRKYRSKTWYVHPKKRRSRLITGMAIKNKRGSFFKSKKVGARGKVTVRWGRNHGKVKRRVRVGPQGGVKMGVNKPGMKKRVKVGPHGVVKMGVNKPGMKKRVKVGPHGGVKIGVKKPGMTKKIRIGPGGKVRGKIKIKGPGGKVKIKRKGGKRRKR